MAELPRGPSALLVGLLALVPSTLHAAPRGYEGPSGVTAEGALDERAAVDDAEPPVDAAPLESIAPPPPRPAGVPRGVESGPATGEPELERRIVRVDTDALHGSTREAAFAHAGGRTVISVARALERGASSVGEVLDRAPGVRALDGVAGTSGPTRLNVAVRGANPRLSEEATVLLDEVPIAMGPYGQPNLSLFPISLFSIDRVDAVRSGASVRFGPTTVGGVFNLVSKPIPEAPEIKVASRVDQWGTYQGGAAFGTTAGKLGIYAEYAPQAGRTYRQHSEFQAHGSLLKLVWTPWRKVEIGSTTHGWFEHTLLPGGLSRAQYDQDRFQSVRLEDEFDGWRAGEAVKVRVRPRENHEVALIAWYNRSYRSTRFRGTSDFGLVDLPRNYHVVGVEPRYAVRLVHKRGAHHDLAFGVRGVFERASLQRFEQLDGVERTRAYDYDVRLGAFAAYAEDELYLADDAVVVRAGVRGEVVRQSRRDNALFNVDPQGAVLSRTYAQALPSVSIRYEPLDELGVFLAYARSFSAPSFTRIGLANNTMTPLDPVLADTVELGIKVAELGGLYAEATGWFRHYANLFDEGESSIDRIGNWYGGGAELDVEWEPGEVWTSLEGSSLYGGYAYTDSRIYSSPLAFDGNPVSWFPKHEAWSGLAYAFPWPCGFFAAMPGPSDCRVLKLGADVTYSGAQFSYYDGDTSYGPSNGATGLIPAYALVDVYLKFQTVLPRAWVLNLSLGVKNVADTSWYYRTDDLNRGILAQRPRTFFVGLDIAYTFFGAHERAEARRARRAERKETR